MTNLKSHIDEYNRIVELANSTSRRAATIDGFRIKDSDNDYWKLPSYRANAHEKLEELNQLEQKLNQPKTNSKLQKIVLSDNTKQILQSDITKLSKANEDVLYSINQWESLPVNSYNEYFPKKYAKWCIDEHNSIIDELVVIKRKDFFDFASILSKESASAVLAGMNNSSTAANGGSGGGSDGSSGGDSDGSSGGGSDGSSEGADENAKQQDELNEAKNGGGEDNNSSSENDIYKPYSGISILNPDRFFLSFDPTPITFKSMIKFCFVLNYFTGLLVIAYSHFDITILYGAELYFITFVFGLYGYLIAKSHLTILLIIITIILFIFLLTHNDTTRLVAKILFIIGIFGIIYYTFVR